VSTAAVMVHCKDADDHTSWEDDLVVQRERYRRLGLDFVEAEAREDTACILRSKRLHNVVIAGGRERDPQGHLTPDSKCDYDSVIMGAKTFIAGVEKATDRALLFGGWRSLDEGERLALFLVWFEDGLAVGREVVRAGSEGPLVAAGKEWHAPRTELTGGRYVVEGWLRSVDAGAAKATYERLRCELTENLDFEGCTTLDSVVVDATR
jgi:hypothetical protein